MERSWTRGGRTYTQVTGFTRFERQLYRETAKPDKYKGFRADPRIVNRIKSRKRAQKLSVARSRLKQASIRSLELKNKITLAEVKFRDILKSEGFQFMEQHIFWLSSWKYRIVDFYLTRPVKLAFEIDGGYHEQDHVAKYDAWKDNALLRAKGITTVRITNDQVIEKPGEVVALLRALKPHTP